MDRLLDGCSSVVREFMSETVVKKVCVNPYVWAAEEEFRYEDREYKRWELIKDPMKEILEWERVIKETTPL